MLSVRRSLIVLRSVSAMRLWALLGIKQKRFAEAEKFLRQAVKVAPEFGRAWNDLCGVQLEQENYDDRCGFSISFLVFN